MAQEQKNMAGLIQIPYNLRELFTFQDGRRQTEILKKMRISQTVLRIPYNIKNKKKLAC